MSRERSSHGKQAPADPLTVKIAYEVTDLIGFKPLKYMTGYERGDSVLWELREVLRDQHKEVENKVREKLKWCTSRLDIKLDFKNGRSYLFIFVHCRTNSTLVRKQYGRTFAGRRKTN